MTGHERMTIVIGKDSVDVCADCTTWARIVEWTDDHGATV